MWGIPASLLIKVAIGVAIAGALFASYKYVDGRLEEHYAGPVRAAWEADKAARIKRTTEITLEMSTKLMEAKDAQAKAESAVNARFSGLSTRAAGLPRTDIALSGATVGVLDDATRAANAARPGAGTEARANPVPAAAEAQGGVYEERDVAAYGVAAALAYADAYGLWKACRVREDQYLISMTKGAAQ